MRPELRTPERDLLDHVAIWFQAQAGAEVFAEVPVVGYGIADLAIRFRAHRRLLVVEGKAGDGWEAYWQACRWAGRCSESYVAVPWSPKRTERERGIAAAIADAYEHVHIGRIEVARNGMVTKAVHARDFGDRFIDCGLDAELRPKRLWSQENGAGLPGAPRWTERKQSFAEAEAALSHVLDRRPRITVAKALRLIEAPRGFREYLVQQKRIQMVGGVWLFVPVVEAAA